MKKLLLCLIVVLSGNLLVYGWGPNAHLNISNRIMEDASITYQINRWGLDKGSLGSAAEWADINEPSAWHSAQWTDTSSLANFQSTWLTSARPVSNNDGGWLLHNIEDTAVPVDHCPSCNWYQSQCMEDQFEAQGETYSTPGWPSPTCYTSQSDYNGNINGFYNNMYSLATSFKNHNNSYFPCKYFCTCMTDWIDPSCRQAAMKNAYVTFWWFWHTILN